MSDEASIQDLIDRCDDYHRMPDTDKHKDGVIIHIFETRLILTEKEIKAIKERLALISVAYTLNDPSFVSVSDLILLQILKTSW